MMKVLFVDNLFTRNLEIMRDVMYFQEGDAENDGRTMVVENTNEQHVTANGVPRDVVTVYATSTNVDVPHGTDGKVRR